MGVDPADVDPRVLANTAFVHVKKRGADVRRREFRKIRWLMADMNVAPAYTLDTVEAIVTHREVDVRGMLLTLKLPDWKLADELPDWLARVRSWGYGHAQARQLHHNRQEVCLAAEARGLGRSVAGQAVLAPSGRIGYHNRTKPGQTCGPVRGPNPFINL